MKSFEYQCLDFWRSKPRREKYDYYNNYDCASAQFLKGSKLARNPCCGEIGGWWDKSNAANSGQLPPSMIDAAKERPWTFGAAADRLAKLLQP